MTTALILCAAVAFVSVAATEMLTGLARGLRRLSARRRLAADARCCRGRCTTADQARRVR